MKLILVFCKELTGFYFMFAFIAIFKFLYHSNPVTWNTLLLHSLHQWSNWVAPCISFNKYAIEGYHTASSLLPINKTKKLTFLLQGKLIGHELSRLQAILWGVTKTQVPRSKPIISQSLLIKIWYSAYNLLHWQISTCLFTVYSIAETISIN